MNTAVKPAQATCLKQQDTTKVGTSSHKKPYDYVVGDNDIDGNPIVKIYAKFPEFLVYRTKSAIRIDINDDHTNKDQTINNHMKISVDLGRLYSWLPEELDNSEPVNRQISRAMTTNALGNFEDAQKLLKHAEERILKTKTLVGRLDYTVSAFSFVSFIATITLITACLVGPGEVRTLLYVVLSGSLGGLLSISLGFSKLEIDLDSTNQTNRLIGYSRVIIAISAAIFSYFAIKSEIAFTFIAKSHQHYGLYMIAMMSGFIERLIPNMMNNLAKTEEPKS
ncbi:hypothetical protein AB3472_13630 [Pseudomonas lurida]|uniref:hypothetical protein n=1 Tax=Pseudomonas lurida TaxID=244566 RepID=UPI0037CBE6CF